MWACAAVFGAVLGLACSRCLLDVTPDPYVPPPLVIQGTKPDAEDAGP